MPRSRIPAAIFATGPGPMNRRPRRLVPTALAVLPLALGLPPAAAVAGPSRATPGGSTPGQVIADVPVAVTVAGVIRPQGTIRVALCSQKSFAAALRAEGTCEFRAQATLAGPPPTDEVTIVIHNVPPGRYALQAFQDLDGDGALRRGWFGQPREPVGFGNDAPIADGPPVFDAAAIAVAAPGTGVRLTLRQR